VGLTCCDGTCVDTQTDAGHCGACFSVCPSGDCENGNCYEGCGIGPWEVIIGSAPDGVSGLIVDDNVDIYVDNVKVVSTTNYANPKPAFSLTIHQGSTIRVVGRDTQGFCAYMSPQYLYRTCDGTTVTLSANGFSTGCGRPAGDNGVFYDQSYTVRF
jgi:hypothetical protein